MSIFSSFTKSFSHGIGIDLGTANTLVYSKDKGVIINEPSVVAVNQKTGKIVAVGSQAKDMLGRTPVHIKAVRPLIDGVISDFEVTSEMLSYFIRRAMEHTGSWVGPHVVIGIPSGVTNVEARAVYDAARNAGAKEVYIVEEPMAGAVGVRLPVHDPVGSIIIDIGGGTTDIAVISLGGTVISKNLKIAGDRLNTDIITYVKNEFKLLIGEKTAEEVKIAIGSAVPVEKAEARIRGRDMATGLPREITVTDTDIRRAMKPSLTALVDGVRHAIETAPPEILSDALTRGVTLIGGGALIRGIDILFSEALLVPIQIAQDPLTAVVRGTAIILENVSAYKDMLIQVDDLSHSHFS